MYRSADVIGQCGVPAFAIHQVGYIGGMIGGLALAHMVSIPGGVAFGFGLYAVCFVVSVVLAKTPDSMPPRFWSNNTFLCRAWWLAAYSGNQLVRDLNVSVATGKNWPLTWYWPLCLRYISCPILAIVFSFSYPSFIANRCDPLMIFAFVVGHLAIVTIISLLILPQWLSPIIPTERRDEGDRGYAPQVVLGADDIRLTRGVEANGSGSDDSTFEKRDETDLTPGKR